MIVDDTLVLSDHQAITATARSTNIIDLGAAGTAFGHSAAVARDVGKATHIPMNVAITEVFNNLTSLRVDLQVDDDVAFGSAKTVASRTYLLADIDATTQLDFPAELPVGTDERYLSLLYTVTGTAPTTGKVFAGIVAARQSN